MRMLFLIAALLVLSSVAAAQETDAGARSVRIHEERPPEGSMRRGFFPAPDWAVVLAGSLVAAGAAGVLTYRLVRSRRP